MAMARLGVYLSDELDKRFKEFVFKKTGSFRGQSKFAVKAIEEYLERHESELKEKAGNEIPALS